MVSGWYYREDAQVDALYRGHSYKVITRAGLKRIDAYDPHEIAKKIARHPGVVDHEVIDAVPAVWIYLRAPWVCTTSAADRTIHEPSIRAAWAHLQGARPVVCPDDIAADEAAYARAIGGAR